MRSHRLIALLAAAILAAAGTANLAAAGITVKQAGDTITIAGGKCMEITSDKFALSKDAWYVIKIAYTGADGSICQLSLATEAMVNAKDTIGGLMTNWMEPSTTEMVKQVGSLKSDSYMIYVDQADGPWTVEIARNPKPVSVSTTAKVQGTTNKVSPFFHLNQGKASFTINQKLEGPFSARIQVELFNGDTGVFVTDLIHNSTSPTFTVSADIPASGNYLLEVSGGGTWDVSWTQ